jgi:hypothetical protein
MVHEEFGFMRVGDGACSRAGVAAFAIDYGPEIWTYHVARDRFAIVEGRQFAGRYDVSGVRLVVSDTGSSSSAGLTRRAIIPFASTHSPNPNHAVDPGLAPEPWGADHGRLGGI